MESPIPKGLWTGLFNGTCVVLGGGILYSLYSQRSAERAVLSKPFSALRRAAQNADQLAAVNEILDVIVEEGRAKKGVSKLTVHDNFDAIVGLLKLKEDMSNASVIEAALKVIQKTCAEPEGRNAFHRAGGYRRVMSVMSEGFRHGIRRLMEDSALTLQMLTEVNDEDVVLPVDVPFGAEGARAVCEYSSTANMLKTLDPSSPIVFLNAVTGVFANLCILRAGSERIGKGVDGTAGVHFFMKLLGHGNPGVVEHCARALRFLCRNQVSHDVFARPESLEVLAALLNPNKDPRTVASVQTVILIMLDSPHKVEFFANLQKTDALQSLFLVWCKGPEKSIRDRAEVLIHLLERATSCGPTIKALTEIHRSNILERKARDEEEAKKRQQQMRQQQAFQQMMMQQMGGGGGDMAAMMGGEEGMMM